MNAETAFVMCPHPSSIDSKSTALGAAGHVTNPGHISAILWRATKWRSVKYEDIYLRAYENGRDLQAGLTRYFDFYNRRRIHQSHDYQTPDEIYYSTAIKEPFAVAA